jgi:hypothetical protein
VTAPALSLPCASDGGTALREKHNRRQVKDFGAFSPHFRQGPEKYGAPCPCTEVQLLHVALRCRAPLFGEAKAPSVA